jgi:C_GCAxxG_C_C family probable redox protein
MEKEQSQILCGNTYRYMENGYHCSEAILLALGEHYLHAVDPLALRLSTPFAGGVGGTHLETCGALTGGILLIGALYGRANVQTNDERCLALAAAFRERFQLEFGWTICQALKGNWVGKAGQPDCKTLTERAAGLLIEMLEAA